MEIAFNTEIVGYHSIVHCTCMRTSLILNSCPANVYRTLYLVKDSYLRDVNFTLFTWLI